MTVQIFDDGSTLEYDYSPGGQGIVAVTPSTDYGYGQNFSAGSFTPGARNVFDLLQYGIGRYADYRVMRDVPQNPTPTYQQPRSPQTNMAAVGSGFNFSGNWMIWAGVGLAGLAVVAALAKSK